MSGDEKAFRKWYAKLAERWGLDKDPDSPWHFYDYRAAFKAGAEPDRSGHMPSRFKRIGHPALFAEGLFTPTAKEAPGAFNPAPPDVTRVALLRYMREHANR